MLITDLLEDVYKAGGTEVEFHLIDKDGNTKKLDLYITNGRYIYEKKDDTVEDIIIIGLTE